MTSSMIDSGISLSPVCGGWFRLPLPVSRGGRGLIGLRVGVFG